ncbi:hypothetical protein PM082_006633 [Marasmius tenuissimus]|nr:hypothetical protein PM082_006633 [Marasmius tenuissimus]
MNIQILLDCSAIRDGIRSVDQKFGPGWGGLAGIGVENSIFAFRLVLLVDPYPTAVKRDEV